MRSTVLPGLLTGALLGLIYGVAEHWDSKAIKDSLSEMLRCGFNGALIGTVANGLAVIFFP